MSKSEVKYAYFHISKQKVMNVLKMFFLFTNETRNEKNELKWPCLY